MKYYSEVTKKLYDTEQALFEDERNYNSAMLNNDKEEQSADNEQDED